MHFIIKNNANKLTSEIATQVFGMQVYPGNEFGLATPLQQSPAICSLYYFDTEADTCMKTKVIVIHCITHM